MKCCYCGKEFEGSPYQKRQIKQGKQVFCSKSCGTSYRYKDLHPNIEESDLVAKLQYMFYETDMSYDEIKSKCGVSQTKFGEIVSKYNIKRTPKQISNLKQTKMKRTMMERYGVENSMSVKEFRDSVSNSHKARTKEQIENSTHKRQQTKLNKYGDANYHNIDKTKQTMMQRYGVTMGYQTDTAITNRINAVQRIYGVDNAFKSKQVHQLSIKSIKEKYGVCSTLQVPTIKLKIKRTMKTKYGVENPMKCEELKQKLMHTMKTKYGVEYGCMTPQCREATPLTISKLNRSWFDKIYKEIGIKPEFEKNINNMSYDLCIGNLLIDINPSISHNSTYGFLFMTGRSDKNRPVKYNYHYNRAINAINNGYMLISVFDWMDKDKIIDIIKAKLRCLNTKIYGNKCKVKEISQSDANEFLDKYHLQGGTTGQSVCIGLFYQDELVQVQTFGKPRFNKRAEWEAIRLASKTDTFILGGVTKGFNYFVKKYNPKTIISYNSLNISTGATDDMQGFKLQGYSKSQGMWVNMLNNDNPNFIRDMSLRSQGIDRLLHKPSTNYPDYQGTFETSNEYLIIKEGYVKVYDCGNVTYMWTNPNQ